MQTIEQLAPPTDSPFTPSHHRELSAATSLAQPIRRAGRVAAFNAWATAIFAVCSAPFAFMGYEGLAVFACLSLIAWNEFRGRRRMLDFDPVGATILAWNQLAMLALIAAYCAWKIYDGRHGTSSYDAELAANPELRAALGQLGDFNDLYNQVVLLTYGTVLIISTIFQGGNAIYYFTRRAHIDDYNLATPEWVRDVQRAAR